MISDDLDGNPSNPRLRAVYLNLAEYVAPGSVERGEEIFVEGEYECYLEGNVLVLSEKKTS